MENRDNLIDEMEAVSNKMSSIIDDMIAHYGKFVTLKDNKNNDKYLVDLVRNYEKLNEQRDYLAAQFDLFN